MPEVPLAYLQSVHAPPPRTLIDIIYDTAARYPDAAGIDDGTVQLSYAEMVADIEEGVQWLAARGIGRGDRIGIRMPSGSYSLYMAILSTLAAGAAYVPVDADDPEERAELVFGEAAVAAILTETGLARGPGSSRGWAATAPAVGDDAWIIFTSGSTGVPKGVAVTHRNAAALSMPRHECFCWTTQSVLETGYWPVYRWRSMHLARRCGSLGAMGPVWFRPRVPWFAAAWIWAHGWSLGTSPWSRRCRHWRHCGRPRLWRPCDC